ELGAEHRLEAERAAALDLRAQHLAGRRPDRLAIRPRDVAEDERRLLEPGDAAQGREVRDHPEVAVPALPVRHRVARDGVHLHVEREQVVATLDRLAVTGRLHEELGVEALPHQAALHVGEGDDHRVDAAVLDLAREVLARQHRLARPGLGHHQLFCSLRARATNRSNRRRAHARSLVNSSGWHWTATIRPSSDSTPSTVPSSPWAVSRKPRARSFTAWWWKLLTLIWCSPAACASSESGWTLTLCARWLRPWPRMSWSSRCCTSVPPSATLITCWPRQIPSTGSSRSRACSNMRSSASSSSRSIGPTFSSFGSP